MGRKKTLPHYETDLIESGLIKKVEEVKKSFTQWNIVGDGSFIPSRETVSRLEAGLYEAAWNSQAQDYAFMRQAINTDELYELPTKEIQEILKDIKSFWNKADLYKKYRLMHKRGILLYGDPGCGKSGILQLCMMNIIKDLSGIVINLKDEDSVKAYVETISKFRQIEPERPLIVIIEDIDGMAGDNNYVNSILLNVLDGVKQIENVVYIATTNYPEKLAERITNRPSRFDRRYYIAPPTNEVRKSYLQNKCKGLDIDIDKWVKDTEGMSMSHLKELFISVILLDVKYQDAIDHLQGLKKSPRGKGQKSIGFNSEI